MKKHRDEKLSIALSFYLLFKYLNVPFRDIDFSYAWHILFKYGLKGQELIYSLSWFVNFISEHFQFILLIWIIHEQEKNYSPGSRLYYTSKALKAYIILELPIFVLWYSQPPLMAQGALILVVFSFALFHMFKDGKLNT